MAYVAFTILAVPLIYCPCCCLSPCCQLIDLSRKLLGQWLFEKMMKMTFYGQFVAGEDHESIKPLIKKNQAFGVGAVLDYSVEEDLTQEEAVKKEMEWVYCLHPTVTTGPLSVAKRFRCGSKPRAALMYVKCAAQERGVVSCIRVSCFNGRNQTARSGPRAAWSPRRGNKNRDPFPPMSAPRICLIIGPL